MAAPTKVPETLEGSVLFNLDPLVMKWPYSIDYVHSYAQDTPFFAALAEQRLLGSRCPACDYVYATPRGHCMRCGGPNEWHELPLQGRVHSHTTCYFGGEAFLDETPFTLVLVEFEGVDTLFLSRIVGAGEGEVSIGMPIKARFLRNSKFKPTDVYFVSADAPESARAVQAGAATTRAVPGARPAAGPSQGLALAEDDACISLDCAPKSGCEQPGCGAA